MSMRSGAVSVRKSKVYRGELRKSNVVRHWKDVHEVVLVVPDHHQIQ